MMSMPLYVSTAALMKRSAKSGAVTLPGHAIASPPTALMSETVCSAGSRSRSLTTTRAPSDASLNAIARPMPRPDPDTSATLPANVPIAFPSPGQIDGLSQRNQCFAGGLDLTELVDCLKFDAHELFAVALLFSDDLAGAGDHVTQMRDADKAGVEAAQRGLRHPAGNEAPEIRHRQHSVPEHVRHAGLAGDIGIDVQWHVIARCSSEQR